MSNLFIRRPVEQGKSFRTPLQPKRGEFKSVDPLSLHLTLLNRDGIDTVSMRRVAQIMDEAPESTKETLVVSRGRAILVGQKALSCSVALEIDDSTDTLQQEFEYFQSLKETKMPTDQQKIFFGHVTLARGIQYPQAAQLTERLNRKIAHASITLRPPILRVGNDGQPSDKVA